MTAYFRTADQHGAESLCCKSEHQKRVFCWGCGGWGGEVAVQEVIGVGGGGVVVVVQEVTGVGRLGSDGQLGGSPSGFWAAWCPAFSLMPDLCY